MKVFISSLIVGMESFRDAAADAMRSLGHQPVRAEDFGANPNSPQQVCLEGVRSSEAFVLLVGEHYGSRQASGLSATHEEYREAKERCSILVFVQQGVSRDTDQTAFLSEVRNWVAGHYTADFRAPADLRDSVARELHRLELALASGPVDEAQLVRSASDLAALTGTADRTSAPLITLAVTGGPTQQVLRPAELEDGAFIRSMTQDVLFGPNALFDSALGSVPSITENALLLRQSTGASVQIDGRGNVRIVQPATETPTLGINGSITSLIEEHVREKIEQALRFAATLLDRVDATRRIRSVVPVIGLLNAGYVPWRSMAEHQASPYSANLGQRPDTLLVQLSPPSLTRSALSQDAQALSADFVALLHRQASR